MINHIPIKQVWIKENIILIKNVQIWVDQKMLNNLLKKGYLLRTKVQKLGSPKNKRIQKT
jgi:hypothetical protein